MQRLYVIVSPDGRTAEQVAEIREQVRSDVEEGMMEDVTLMLPTPGIEGVAADVDAIVNSDLVISTIGSMHNRDCRICNFVASEYMQYGVYEEDWVAEMIRQRKEEREQAITEEVPDEDVPA